MNISGELSKGHFLEVAIGSGDWIDGLAEEPFPATVLAFEPGSACFGLASKPSTKRLTETSVGWDIVARFASFRLVRGCRSLYRPAQVAS